MGETRVDLLHLLEDLRDGYPGGAEETIVTEIVANALDSGASAITIVTDTSAPALTIVDDGAGMRRRELARYHDVAASSKVRGAGIGFAGVGIKVALLVCAEVVTETRRGRHSAASAWQLASRHRAPWRWIASPGLAAGRGTAIRLTLANPLSPLVDPAFVESVLRRNFQPLFDPALADALRGRYPRGVTFTLDGHGLEPQAWRAAESAPLAIRVAGQPAGAGYLTRDAGPLPEASRGVAVSTYGKVIKRGWDWLGIVAVSPERIGGLLEVPALAACLTLNKSDFIRAGAGGATYLACRQAIQEAVTRQLIEWGQAGDPGERARQRVARPVERELEALLAELADDFPSLASLVEDRTAGQQGLPMARAGAGRLSIRFEHRPDDADLSRMIDSTVWVNEGHPAYRRAAASRSEGYHAAVAVAMALAPLAVDPAKEHAFVTAFLARWGAAIERRTARRW
jgi:molecular chaperone HtpG